MQFVIVLLLAAVIGYVMYFRAKNRFNSKHPWQHFFDNFSFSAEEFFQQVESGIRDRKVPNVSFGRESFLETHLLSDRREYLRITRNEFVYYVCAAPFGTGMFVSWWLCEKRQNNFNPGRIPFIGKLFGKERDNKTFYQLDVETMYRSAVHSTVMDVLDKTTSASGARGLTELEKQFKEHR